MEMSYRVKKLVWLMCIGFGIGAFIGGFGYLIVTTQKFEDKKTYVVTWPNHVPVTIVGENHINATNCGECFIDKSGHRFDCVTDAEVEEIK
jgi:hypothetical protein